MVFIRNVLITKTPFILVQIQNYSTRLLEVERPTVKYSVVSTDVSLGSAALYTPFLFK